MLGWLPPGIVAAEDELPHLTAEEAVGPLGPFFARVMPFAADGVHREVIGVGFDEGFDVTLGEIEGVVVGGGLLRSEHSWVRGKRLNCSTKMTMAAAASTPI